MKNKPKLLIISNLYPSPWEPSRATYNKQQFTYLQAYFDIYILVPVAWPDYLKHRKEINNNNSKIRYCAYFYTPKFGRRFYSWWMLLSIYLSSYLWIKSLNINAIFASWAYPDGVAAYRLSKKLNVPFYLKVHGSDINIFSQSPPRAKQIREAANQSKGVLSVSQALANKMIDMGIQKDLIQVIYNGVNQELFNYRSNNKENSNSLLFIGNLKKTKGVTELLESFNTIHKKHPQLSLSFAGEGEMRNLLQQKITEYQLADKVNLLGSISHHLLPKLIQEAKLLILPSYNEGVPNVILESLACGTPVVATAVGGIPEIITNGTSGILIDSPNPQDITSGLEKALNQSWDRLSIAKSAKCFDWQENINKLSKLLQLNT